MIKCQFCNFRIRIRDDIHIAHHAMEIAAHIMNYHTHTWLPMDLGEEE